MKQNIEIPRMNHIDLKITYACNYKCEYCYQAERGGVKRYRKDFLSKENAENFVEFCRRMGESFHITLAGGEPFVYPYLEYLGESLTALGNSINLITNFSAPIEKIYRFLDGGHDKVEWFNISVHLSQWKDIEEFYQKLNLLQKYKEEKGASFSVNLTCVVTKDNFAAVKELDKNIEERFRNIPLHLQRVQYDGIYEIYSNDIEAYLEDKGVTVAKEEANKIDFYGRICWGGVRFFYIESNGDIRRCYTKQKNKNIFLLGNLGQLDQIKIFQEPYPCLSADNGNCICHSHFVNERFVTQVIAADEEISNWMDK